MKSLAEQYQEDLGEGGFDLINFGLTWNNETAIDHAFCNKPESVKNYGIIMRRHFSDHNRIHTWSLKQTYLEYKFEQTC